MNPDEKKKLAKELCRRWGKAFDGPEIQRWAHELDDRPLDDVIAALTKYYDGNRFAPKLPDIVKLLPSSTTTSTSQGEGGFADVMRRTHFHLRNVENDTEVIVRYWRSVWFMYEPGASRRLEAIRDAGADVTEFQRQFENTKRGILQRCVNTLATEAKTEDGKPLTRLEAERMAEFIFASPEMFRMLLSELRGLANVFD